MSTRRILTIGLEVASPDTQHASFRSKTSLLDWDIVLFKPRIDEFFSYGDYYQGKESLSDSASFQLKECCEHWRREIKQAVEAGKTVVVFCRNFRRSSSTRASGPTPVPVATKRPHVTSRSMTTIRPYQPLYHR